MIQVPHVVVNHLGDFGMTTVHQLPARHV
jgi:hypothetical protein